ncbi:MAG: SUMF1/EgtB/PvdO family nonheme iron enzyme [Sphaerochaetaceae bacterium]
MKKKILEDLVKVEPVKLKPMFGLRPGVYLTILYSAIIVVSVFLVGFLPDIIHGYKRVSFTSSVEGVAIYVDGQYKGAAPFSANIKSGNHEIIYKSSGVVIDTKQIEVGHPVFFNWLFPRRMSVNSDASLNQEALAAACQAFIKDVSLWSAQTSFTEVNPYRPLFTQFSHKVGQNGTSQNVIEGSSVSDVLDLAFSFITSPEMLKDARQACQSLGITHDFSIQEKLLTDNSEYIGKNAVSRTSQGGSSSLSYDKTLIEGTLIKEASITIGKRTLNTYPEVLETSADAYCKDFYIANSEVTEYQYALFLSENPDWKLANIEQLKSQGLVDDYYLYGISLTSRTNPIRNISVKAAEAYCRWISEKTGKNVYLPSQVEWEAALASIDSSYQNTLASTNNNSVLGSLLGGVWEMTSSKFIPLSRLIKTDEKLLMALAPDADIILKGGSYLNSDIDAFSVGGFATSACSELTGFRVAWEK